jgi:predicted amidophosphoribosyltransferase
MQFVQPQLRLSSCSHISQHFYLIQWKKDEKKFIDNLSYRLKAGQSVLAWKLYSEILTKHLRAYIQVNSFAGIIPLPPSHPKRKHTQIFATFMSEFLNIPVCDILQRDPSTHKQNLKSKVQRGQSLNISLKATTNEDFTNLVGPFIYLDDVLTTGQTYFQSKAVVTPSASDMIITLFYRINHNTTLY